MLSSFGIRIQYDILLIKYAEIRFYIKVVIYYFPTVKPHPSTGFLTLDVSLHQSKCQVLTSVNYFKNPNLAISVRKFNLYGDKETSKSQIV